MRVKGHGALVMWARRGRGKQGHEKVGGAVARSTKVKVRRRRRRRRKKRGVRGKIWGKA